MSHRSNSTPRFTRVTTTLGLAGVAAIAMAARSQTAQQPPAALPATAPAPAMAPAMAPMDSQTTAAALAADSMAMMAAPAAPTVAQQPVPAATWPVDAEGRTLVNGTPVVGKVFVMQKVDGLVKYEYAKVYAGEPPAPDAPIVSAQHAAPAPGHARRIRGMMVQGTLWSLDNKPTARELRMYRPVTSPATPGQH